MKRSRLTVALVLAIAPFVMIATSRSDEKAAQPSDDRECQQWPESKTGTKIKGSLRDAPGYVFTHFASIDGDGKVEPRRSVHVLRNDDPKIILSAGWEKAGLPFVEDGGYCRMVTNETWTLKYHENPAQVVYGTKGQFRKEAPCFIAEGKGKAGVENKGGDCEAEPSDPDPFKPVSSRIVSSWSIEKAGRPSHLDFRLISSVTKKSGEYLYTYKVENRTSASLLFEVPDLTRAWARIEHETKSYTRWKSPESDRGPFVVEPREGISSPRSSTWEIQTIKPLTPNEISCQLNILNEIDKQRIAGGLVTVYLPNEK